MFSDATHAAMRLLLILLISLSPFASVSGSAAHELAKLGKLGTVRFPTSARSSDAQAHFLRGVAALHSFWYPIALDEFRAAARIEPDFAMAYWGEAMTYNHPLWGDPQETDTARQVLSRADLSPGLTPRERAYLGAVRVLYGDGDKLQRDRNYAAAMGEIYRAYPEDREAAAFYALALLGAVRSDDPTALRTRMKAGALVQEVYRLEPDHPGAAHYILHAFDDPDHAVLALRAAARIEPDFAMAYWGEAMTYNHPLWGDPQETDTARQVLSRAHPSPDLTPRERAYLGAVRVLYGDGDKIQRDRSYAAAMEEIYRTYPEDREAAAFYALALLGSVRSDDPTALRTRMKAGALVQEVYRLEPDHPGAAHYIVHAFDDPDHAVLALRAAQQYAEIAPGAPHALHMPSHIFLQLGLWRETAASNEAAWAASFSLERGRLGGLGSVGQGTRFVHRRA